VEDFVLDLMTDSCIVACAIGNDDVSVQGKEKHDDQPEMQGRTVDEALDRQGHPRGRIPGRKAPDAAGVRGVRRRITLSTRYLGRTEHGGGCPVACTGAACMISCVRA
jgi:hypothetical protein